MDELAFYLKVVMHVAMKKCLLLLMAVSFMLTVSADQIGRGDTVLRVLAIGNSFSSDALESYLYDLAKAANKKIVIGNMVIGGASLKTHLENAQQDNASYSYFKIELDGTATTTKKVALSTALKDENWNYISLQQHSPLSGKYEAIVQNLPGLIGYVKHIAPSSQLIYHQTWAYEGTSDHKRFVDYDRNQMKMYKSIADATKRIMELEYFKHLVPAGTAIQNGRTSELGDTFTRDGFHLKKSYGRFTVACCWYEIVFDEDIRKNPFYPDNLSETEAKIAKVAAHDAVKRPFKVTPIKPGSNRLRD